MTMECELAVKEVLPATRALLAAELSDMHMTQDEIAEKLNLTQSAVSRYLKQSRGKKAAKFMKNPKVKKLIKSTAENLRKGKKFDFCSRST